ncbi:polygalacturonase-1 non-catalytic subunit beta-like [Olea europaea var. sylvestris]|uniref:polygalacturonase-1 non-catalytic subunit beta-like n=1 Tax=Olea europaea var. sylvestris TaxID=158386 RepID=UPI000C1D1465|nr:polygalacturonase-1 non-catalytic subunit beta-like [Olea europaea var. sylvestris]
MVPPTKQTHQHSHSYLTKKMHSIFFFPLFLLFTVGVKTGVESSGAGENPFTPKGYVIRYWKKQISNDSPKPLFLLNKASPLDSVQFAAFSKLADQRSLATHLPEFCARANLLCFPDLTPSLEKHDGNVNFAAYNERNFTNYGTGRPGGVDSFKNYSDGENIPIDTFRRYSRDSNGHKDKFTSYASNANVADGSFNTYGTAATGGVGDFSNYNNEVNVPNLRFTSYTDNGNGREQSFSSYTNEANSGDEKFTSYGKNANGAVNAFNSYGKDANVIGSTFDNYGEIGNGANDSFTSYGNNGNVPENTFKNYGTGGNVPVETFKTYRDQSNVGDDNFQTYGKGSNTATVNFENYGQSFNEGSDKFSSYGKDASGETVGFKIYGVNNTFKEYTKKGVTFARYNETTTAAGPTTATLAAESGKKVNKWVEPGKFFREEMLKGGNVMPMPDIRDKMPKRSFLPRVIVSKLPFSTSKLRELKEIFHAGDDDSSMAKMLADSLSECERAPSPGETKRCVASIEEMIDFATSVLGRKVVVRTTENTRGYNSNIMIGKVKGINSGKVTRSVSCHQSLYPYLLYYCHSVPKVRVYEADILDPNSKSKINHGVAICHLDTSSWSPDHGAFIALGSVPGKIEVCHWIFENDMTWTIGD